MVLQSTKKASLYLKHKKYKFHIQRTKCLSLIIWFDSIFMDLANGATVK